jgi:hypothetical protein
MSIASKYRPPQLRAMIKRASKLLEYYKNPSVDHPAYTKCPLCYAGQYNSDCKFCCYNFGEEKNITERCIQPINVGTSFKRILVANYNSAKLTRHTKHEVEQFRLRRIKELNLFIQKATDQLNGKYHDNT